MLFVIWRRVLMPTLDSALALGMFRIALCVAWFVEVSPRLVAALFVVSARVVFSAWWVG
jgi:hypothetical protein